MNRHVTRVFNDTEVVIELKEGSANVFHPLHILPSGKSYNMKVDESATYREYWCQVQPDTSAERVVFSSDDCTEFSKVRIYKDPTSGKYTWEGTERRGTWRNTPVSPARVSNPVHDAKPPTWWTRFFRKKN